MYKAILFNVIHKTLTALHWPGFEYIEGPVALFVSLTERNQLVFLNVRGGIDQVGTFVGINIFHREPPVPVSGLG